MAQPQAMHETAATRPRGWPARIGAGFSAAVGTAAGAAPHVLHHVGPLAGAALVAGAAGTLLFGALGFVLMLPMLLGLRRKSGSWAAPAVALALFAALFTVSTLWVGPALRGDGGGAVVGGEPADHSSHHSR